MIIIYSDKSIKSLGGAYTAPRFFDGTIDSRATAVYTSDTKIAEAYRVKGIEVRGFPKTQAKQPPPPLENKETNQID